MILRFFMAGYLIKRQINVVGGLWFIQVSFFRGVFLAADKVDDDTCDDEQ